MDNLYNIENEFLSVSVSLNGAEVHSFYKKGDAYNYVWSGDKKYWGGRNPILFPQVSSTDNKTTLINGTFYPMGNHGFARNCVFKLENIEKESITLSLMQNEDTLKQYPFDFNLFVNYKLVDNKMIISYKIKNNSNINMPYGFGLHPAFSCQEGYDNTIVFLEKNEDIFGSEIKVSNQLFIDYPTVIIDDVKSKYAILSANNHKIKIGFDDFEMLGIWSSGPFVCIEPWMNITDKDHNIEMAKRKGFNELKPSEEFNISYYWEII